MKSFLLAFLLFGCTSIVKPPLPSQLWPYSQQMDAIHAQSNFLSNVYGQIVNQINIETYQILQVLDVTRYYYLRGAEFLISQGRFEEANVYIKQVRKILSEMAIIMKSEQEELKKQGT